MAPENLQHKNSHNFHHRNKNIRLLVMRQMISPTGFRWRSDVHHLIAEDHLRLRQEMWVVSWRRKEGGLLFMASWRFFFEDHEIDVYIYI